MSAPLNLITRKYKGELNYTPLQEYRQGSYLPSFGHEPVGGYTVGNMALCKYGY